MSSPISIRVDRHFFTRLNVVANQEFAANEGSRFLGNVPVESSMNVQIVPGEATMICTQTVKFDTTDKASIPYRIDVECVGFFVSNDSQLSDEARELGAVIAHQVLYSAVREMVLTMTARMPWGPFSIGIATLNRPKESAAAIEPSLPPAKKKRVRRKAA